MARVNFVLLPIVLPCLCLFLILLEFGFYFSLFLVAFLTFPMLGPSFFLLLCKAIAISMLLVHLNVQWIPNNASPTLVLHY